MDRRGDGVRNNRASDRNQGVRHASSRRDSRGREESASGAQIRQQDWRRINADRQRKDPRSVSGIWRLFFVARRPTRTVYGSRADNRGQGKGHP
ncbi:Uncharacterized protein APZ42_009048 [Daphnia magna]|uniref:Uncharacterized protein n=1 Tax=Daphnia magna TaxID=35525 RepID=A0A164E8X4_9CRUS|nr:Uncharacterized protein APZ42_009048 [Daphnia magna]